jgi:protoheme IX farnesyltransferase
LLTQLTYTADKEFSLATRLKDYVLLTKFRLTITVVLSALLGYCIATTEINWVILLYLALGGFMITSGANTFNQIIERDIDKLMNRTANRPLPSGRMSVAEALIFAFVMAIGGFFMLSYFVNPFSGLIGITSLLLYVLAYTPLKRISSISVLVGAIPGALPPLIGWVAATNKLSFEAWILFSIQFIWQFPHFWAIAWVLNDEYQKAGFKMLPSSGGKNKGTAFQIMAYTLGLIPISLLPFMFKISGASSAILICIAGIIFSILSLKLYRGCTDELAKKIMFFSFIYLPLIQLLLVLNKL